MNRINALFLIFISSILLFLLVFKYISINVEKEPQVIRVPLKIEVYRADRRPLAEADIYLNQRFIGRTDKRGFFSKNVELIVGQKYTIHIEKDRDGYVYGPWETHFVPEVEKKRTKRKKKSEEMDNVNILEGESDILTELERAKLGRASLYEKYHFLAILSGYMFYNIKVLSHKGREIAGARVIINGKYEGSTDESGNFTVKYEGDDERVDRIEIAKEGEHLWMDDVKISPNYQIVIELNKMLIVDTHIQTENYGVLGGVENAMVVIKNRVMGKTDSDGFLRFKYRNEKGVDGDLTVKLDFPPGYLPSVSVKNFYIKRSLPKLIIHDFTYNKKPPSPKIAVLPFKVEGRVTNYLVRNSTFLSKSIEDYLRSGRFFNVVKSDEIVNLFKQFNINIENSKNDERVKWEDIPILKKEVDAVIIGKLRGNESGITVVISGINYDGIKIMDVRSQVSTREMKKIPEKVVRLFRRRFQVEGVITKVGKNVYINLGSKNGVKLGDIFNGYINYFDTLTNQFARKRVVKLKVIDTGTYISSCEVENITEGYLLEPGVKIKRSREIVSRQEVVHVSLNVVSSRKKRPISGANVYVNDKWEGQTDNIGNISFDVPSYSELDILIYKEGFIPNRIEVKLDDKDRRITVQLKQGKTKLYIDSDPEKALVFIDGIFCGVTPIIKEPIVVDYGFHLLEVELEGYRPYRKYIKFNVPKLELIDKRKIKLYKDYYGRAELLYERKMIREAVGLLNKITPDHPDYLKALSFLGYIYLNNIKDYSRAIVYYNRYLREARGRVVPIYIYYNLGQAYYNRAEQEYYLDAEYALSDYRNAIYSFKIVKEKRDLLPAISRRETFINSLFYMAVSYQKIYYLSKDKNYLEEAYNSWIDYFDFFDKNLRKQDFFKKQYKIAKSYFEEIERIKSER